MRKCFVIRANSRALEVEDFPTCVAHIVTLVCSNISFSVDIIDVPDLEEVVKEEMTHE